MTDDPIRSASAAPEPLSGWGAEPPAPTSPPVSLWLPRDLAISSALLGFPGGFGLAARNAWRLGRRATAWMLLLVGAAIMLALVFALPEDLPRGAAIGINLAVVVGLVALVRQQVRGVEQAGREVVRAPAGAGLATFVGGWVVTAGPALLIAFMLTFLGAQAQAILAGTVQFGTAGAGCDIDGRASAVPVEAPIHYVASLSRTVNAGETIHFSLRPATGTEIFSQDLAIDSVSDCVAGTVPSRTLSAGTYVFEFTMGAERLAIGEVTITGP